MSVRKKSRAPRVHLTHFEVRRGSRLRLRIAIADDAIAEVGDELGALFVKIAPGAVSARTVAPNVATPSASVIEVVSETASSEIVLAPEHANGDTEYHASLRCRLAELIGLLCDASLADALEIAREERARRADGVN